MHDALDARLCSSAEERPRVGNCHVVSDLAVRKAHPVGVVQGVSTRHGLSQLLWVGEVKRAAFERSAIWCSLWMTGQRPNLVPPSHQLLGDSRARVAERTGDDVELSHV